MWKELMLKKKYTLLYFKWVTDKELLYSTWNSAHCYAWMGEESGGEWIRVYVCRAESFCWSPETITTLLIVYALVQNQTFKNK